MKKILFLVLLGTQAAFCQDRSGTLSVEKIMRDPKWIGSSPGVAIWNYNSQSLFFSWNPEKASSDSIYQYMIQGKEPTKQAYLEGLRARAIHEGVYNKARSKIAYSLLGDIYLLDVGSGKTIRITKTEAAESDPGFSNHDAWVTYIIDNNLFAWDIQNGNTQQLTRLINGEAPATKKISQQESWLDSEQLRTSEIIKSRKEKRELGQAYIRMTKEKDTLRKIYIGDQKLYELQISPDARFVTYSLIEEPTNAKNTIVPNYVTETGFTTDIPGREKVGVPQGKSSFYIFDRLRDTVIRLVTDSIPGIMDLPDYTKDYPQTGKDKKAIRNCYVVSIQWNEEGAAAVIDLRSEDKKDRWLMQLNTASGYPALLDRQHDDAWIGGPGIGWLSNATLKWIDNNNFYFQSEMTGYSHLYTYNIATHTKKPLTQGNYEVQVATLSRDKKYFYLLTNEEHPGKQHFYRIRTDGSGKEKITSMDGGYEVSISPDEKMIAYRYSYQNKPWELYVQELSTGKPAIQVTHLAMSEEWKAYPWRDTKIFNFPARDGKPVYARIYEPASDKKNGAAVIFVHGAGYLQNVDYAWSYYFHEFMFNNLLADEGYTVMDIDYRASAGYGRDWRTGIYRHMGGKDLDDEVDAAGYLVKERGIDPSRIGLYGGSYGGFMALMALFTQPDVFKAGAALRPVTDWAHYNQGYTSAILNEPFTDSIAYQRSSPINFASGLKNHLLICHGMVDVNVHFQDAVRLAQRLIELGKNNWELAVYPVEDHGFVEPSSWTDEYKRVLKLFDTTLK
jgi:dipeptidyl aminopeptidase/acylaminoacyl peptidase